MSDADELPTEPGILTEAEHQAHREADTMARVERIEQRELQVPSHADSELLWLAQLARELWKTIIAQRTTIAGMEQGQGILGDGKLSASEALYGFMAHLTTRPESCEFGTQHDTCGIAARLVGEFIKANQLPEPRGDWQNNLNFPKP